MNKRIQFFFILLILITLVKGIELSPEIMIGDVGYNILLSPKLESPKEGWCYTKKSEGGIGINFEVSSKIRQRLNMGVGIGFLSLYDFLLEMEDTLLGKFGVGATMIGFPIVVFSNINFLTGKIRPYFTAGVGLYPTYEKVKIILFGVESFGDTLKTYFGGTAKTGVLMFLSERIGVDINSSFHFINTPEKATKTFKIALGIVYRYKILEVE